MTSSSTSAKPPLVSVVTPFYNTARYLEECIRSVLSQTHENFEYILFDNYSTDGSAEIARQFAVLDRRIRYVRSSAFAEQIPNYNRALESISTDSQYCKLVQADDWIYPNCLSEMVALAAANPSVGIVGSYSLYGNILGHGGFPLRYRGVAPGREAIRLFLLRDHGFLGSPTCVLFRSDLVRARRPFFAENRADCEDADACLELLYQCDFGFVHQVLTFNRRDNEGLWNAVEPFEPELLHRFLWMTRHGEAVLGSKDYESRLSEIEGRYYSLLARHWMESRQSPFWRYHLGALRSEGLSLDRARLARAALVDYLNCLLNPMAGLGRLVRHLQSRRGGGTG